MLATRDCPIPLTELAAAIRTSSNFRFAWQTYDMPGMEAWQRHRAPGESDTRWLRTALAEIVEREELHRFLRESFDPMYDPVFRIEPLHAHSRLEECGDDFDETLASAAADQLGAYSRTRNPAPPSEKRRIRELFETAGPYSTCQLLPGNVAGCATCKQHNSHLFTNWFYGVAWDWCLFAAWPQHDLLWMGCLTDTD